MFSIRQEGSWKNTEKLLKNAMGRNYRSILEKYAIQGVSALSAATPKESGVTAASWSYKIVQEKDKLSIVWINDHRNKEVSIAILLQYGHGTRTGGYVKGRDYINPTMRPIFDKIADDAWREVTKR